MSKLRSDYDRFSNVAKLMNKSIKNAETLSRYRRMIIPAYNRFVSFVSENYFKIKQKEQDILDDALLKARFKLIKCL